MVGGCWWVDGGDAACSASLELCAGQAWPLPASLAAAALPPSCRIDPTSHQLPSLPPNARRLIKKAEEELAATEEKDARQEERKQALEAAFGMPSQARKQKAADTLKERARMRKVLDKVRLRGAVGGGGGSGPRWGRVGGPEAKQC